MPILALKRLRTRKLGLLPFPDAASDQKKCNMALFNPKIKAVAYGFNWNYRLSTDRARSVFG
jgi:hypothetical protein